jgi:flagellar hook-associated protein 1 FlgK
MSNVVPQTLADLDAVASSLVTSVNALHVTGHGLDPIADVNLNFFEPTGTTAATLALSVDVAGQPSRIALAGPTEGDLGGALGHQIAALADSTSGPDTVFRNLVGRLGVETRTATSRATIQDRISRQVQEERQTMTGVNLDEEMTSLVATQRAYEAAARMLTAADEMLDQLINRTGMVGR